MKKFLIAFLTAFVVFSAGAAFGSEGMIIPNEELFNRTNNAKVKDIGILQDGTSWKILNYNAPNTGTVNKPKRTYWALFRRYYPNEQNDVKFLDNKLKDINDLIEAGVSEELARKLYFIEYLCIYEPDGRQYREDEIAYFDTGGNVIRVEREQRNNKKLHNVEDNRATKEALRLAKSLGKEFDLKDQKGEEPRYIPGIIPTSAPVSDGIMPWRKDVSCQIIDWDTSEGNKEIIFTVLYKPDKKNKDGRTETIRVPYVNDKKFNGDTFYKKFQGTAKKKDWIYPKNLMFRVPDGWRVDCHRPGVKKIANPDNIENSKLTSYGGNNGVSFDSGEIIILMNTGMTIRPPFDGE